ncbi:MAG: DNA mismatch repair endonuclease MutL [Eubacteriales bacterium]|nr:DNA mismatch repair endonuclease MutL [Eubacteriales bacterium]
MPVIHELDSHMSDLIAAGEVVERPSSVCKELIENSIDAGATQITVEIEHGGIAYLRIQDNGCGMEPADAPTAFLRHATSKIRTKEDLAAIGTLGFRGEALAAISAVSRVDLFTKQEGQLEGTHLFVEAGVVKTNESAGCPEGTTFVIRDLFFNTPARMKFLKKDFTEAGYVLSVVEHAAESHPEIAFRCIRDGKTVFHSPGTGELQQAVFAVFGRELARNLIPIPPMEMEDVRVHGFLSKPHAPRSNRSYQHFFVNGRFIKSKLIQAAMEEAYRNAIITGKFPYGCLCIDLPLSQVDVNVHPAKTEVKFAFEKKIFSAVYAACKGALAAEDNVPEIRAEEVQRKRTGVPATPERVREKPPMAEPKPEQKPAELESIRRMAGLTKSADTSPRTGMMAADRPYKRNTAPSPRRTFRPFVDVDEEDERVLQHPSEQTEMAMPSAAEEAVPSETQPAVPQPEIPEPQSGLEQARPTAKVIGSCFSTYILAEDADGLILIDKHAAHERMLFNQLQKSTEIPTQMLLEPVVVEMTGEEFAVMTENHELVQAVGFQVEPFGHHSIAVREAPAYLDAAEIPMTMSEVAQKLLDRRTPVPDKRDDLIHMVSCKAAIKGGWETSTAELQAICDRVVSDPEVNCCPHGRPVMVRLTKYELDKLFKRVNQ